VVGFADINKTENNFYLFLEYCNGGDLDNLREQKGRFTEDEAKMILRQIVNGFRAIYEQKVMHRDLKLANILLHFPDIEFKYPPDCKDDPILRLDCMNKTLKKLDLMTTKVEVKIADLGFAKQMEQEDLTQTICGTPLVMAPEVLNGKKYNHKADVWSLGIVFFELLTGFTPFTGRDKEDLKRNLNLGAYQFPKQLRLSLQGLDFMNKCLQFDMNKRMSWEELVHHPYLQSD